MKKLSVTICIGIITCAIFAQTRLFPDDLDNLQDIQNICYDEEFTERIRVTGELNTQTLNILDKLKFTNKKYVQKHCEYVNEDGYATHERVFVSHEKMFPKWYTHPTKITSNENGITSFFSNTNEYLRDGWTGGAVSQTQHGEYKVDEITGQRYYQQGYSTLAKEYYEEYDNAVRSMGYLNKFVFTVPSTDALTQFENESFTATSEPDKITVGNGDMVLVWDKADNTYTSQQIENGKAVKTTKTFYTRHEFYNEYLVSKQITITPGNFENGDCYETVTETVFTNYSDGGGKQGKSFRNVKDDGITGRWVSIYPNPVNNKITINIPASDHPSVIKVFDLSGSLIKQRKANAHSRVFKLNIEDLTQGMYIIKVHQGDEIFTNKFVKQ